MLQLGAWRKPLLQQRRDVNWKKSHCKKLDHSKVQNQKPLPRKEFKQGDSQEARGKADFTRVTQFYFSPSGGIVSSPQFPAQKEEHWICEVLKAAGLWAGRTTCYSGNVAFPDLHLPRENDSLVAENILHAKGLRLLPLCV